MAEAGARADEVAANRELWTQANSEYTDEHAYRAWGAEDITWGIFNVPEQQLGVLGDVHGLDVIELGCGTAYFSAWLARRGARPRGRRDSRPAGVRAALPGPVRHHRPAHRGRRGSCPAAVRLFRPGHLRMRRQLVVRPGRLGTGGCQAAATRRETGLPHHHHPGHHVLPRTGRARPPGTAPPAAPGTPPGNSTGRDPVPPRPRRVDQDPARQRPHHRRAARALRPAGCSRSSLLRTGEHRMGPAPVRRQPAERCCP